MLDYANITPQPLIFWK